MKITIYDVAKKADVSIATVSKVINNTGSISDRTRKKVLKVMDDLKYQPSMVASALSGKSTYTIGLTLPDLANPYFAEMARAIEDRGREYGFNVFICSTDNDEKKEEEFYQLFMKKRVDGIIMISRMKDDTIMKKIVNQKVPLVMVTRELTATPVTSVMVDDYLGGYLAGNHLAKLGHRHVYVLAENMKESGSRERVRGCKEALSEQGIELKDHMCIEAGYSLESGRTAMKLLLEREEHFSAIFACNDILAIGAIQAAREFGRSVPAELSVIGFDNTIIATIVDPPLTTIAQPIQEIGGRSVDLLIQQIQTKETIRQRVILMPDLVIRGSTAAINKNTHKV